MRSRILRQRGDGDKPMRAKRPLTLTTKRDDDVNDDTKSLSYASANTTDQGIFGYYTDDDPATPAFDPGRVPCPVCGKPWDGDTVRTISFMPMESGRCYFYRVHRACDTPQATQEIEGRIIDAGMPGH